MRRLAVRPARRVEGSIRVPGDKSISHRAVILAAMGNGDTRILGCAPGAAVASTISCARALGVDVRASQVKVESEGEAHPESAWQILVRGAGLSGLFRPDGDLVCGNSGTTMRMLAGLVAGRPFPARLTGDVYLSRRPMERVAEPLRRMGARVDTTEGHAPVVINGGGLSGISYEVPVPSALVKTAVVLAALQAEGETRIHESMPTRDHTERLLEHLGIPVVQSPNQLVIKSTEIQNAESIDIPGDLSSAAFLLAAAAILPGSELEIRDCGVNPRRTGFLDLLRRFGADVALTGERIVAGEPRATVRVRAAARRALTLGPSDVPDAIDELPLVAVLGAFADGETVVTGAAELRLKESDRIDAICKALAHLGVDISALPDGFTVRGGRPLSGGEADSAGDHRIAMSAAVAALGAREPVTITGWESVGVSYPGFETSLERIVVPADGKSQGT